MENNKNKKSVKFQGDMLNFCDFIQVFVFTRNHHLKGCYGMHNNTSFYVKVCRNASVIKDNFYITPFKAADKMCTLARNVKPSTAQ